MSKYLVGQKVHHKIRNLDGVVFFVPRGNNSPTFFSGDFGSTFANDYALLPVLDSEVG